MSKQSTFSCWCFHPPLSCEYPGAISAPSLPRVADEGRIASEMRKPPHTLCDTLQPGFPRYWLRRVPMTRTFPARGELQPSGGTTTSEVPVRGETAVIAGLTAITAWEIAALRHDPDALISRAVDRIRGRHPIIDVTVRAAIVATALHLGRLIPRSLDVYRVCS